MERHEGGEKEPMETAKGRAITGLAALGFVGFVLFGVNGAVVGGIVGAVIGYLSKRK